jgi:protein-disulfide isomerase
MAARVNMKMFYGLLGGIAVIGAGAVWMAGSRNGGSAVQILEAPIPLGTSAFPGYVIGSKDAPVEIVEYADFTCVHCAEFAILQGPDVKRRLVDTGLARWRFRGFALNQASLLPLHAAACVAEQGKFWEMSDSLMFNQRDWISSGRALSDFRDYAREVGADLGEYDVCMKEARYAARIMVTRDEIANSGIHSTPTFDIGNIRVAGAIPFDSVKALVEKAAGEVRQ